jgi:hypothetical protein
VLHTQSIILGLVGEEVELAGLRESQTGGSLSPRVVPFPFSQNGWDGADTSAAQVCWRSLGFLGNADSEGCHLILGSQEST